MRKKASISFTRDDLLNSDIESASTSSATMYQVMASTSSIIKDGNVLIPSSITFSAYTKVGTGNYSVYSGWFKIQESADGINWTNKYSSASTESSKAYIPTNSAKFVKCILYTDNGFLNEGAMLSIGIIENGQQGASVTISSIKYAVNQNGSVQPDASAFDTTMPTTSQGDWLWIKTTYSSGDVVVSKSYIGTDGQDGSSIYVTSSSKVDGVTTIELSDGTTLTIADGEDGEEGEPGTDGTSEYVHIAWANDTSGGGFSTTISTGKSYIGVYNDTNSTDSGNWRDYNWSLIKGADGVNAAAISLYQRSSTQSVVDWSDQLTYNFSTGSLTTLPDGWYATIPSGDDPVYVTSTIVTAPATDTSINIDPEEWITPVKFVENGLPGKDGKMLWGTCNTEPSTNMKSVVCNDVTTLYTGLIVTVKFSQRSSVNEPTLKVGATPQNFIYINGKRVSSSNKLMWTENTIMTFVYDGTGWVVQDQPIIYSATCTDTAATNNRSVIINGCAIREGTTLMCTFTNAFIPGMDSQRAQLIIKYNQEAQYGITVPIYSNGVQISKDNSWNAGQTVQLVFNGTRWNAGMYTDNDEFTSFTDGTFASFVTNTNTTLNGKITTFYQSSIPTANVVGDLWIDTTDNTNQLKRWNGSTWADVQDKGIQDALSAAADAQSTADSKIITYAMDSPPGPPDIPELDEGDLWIETDANNKLYRWDGTSWNPCTDTSGLDSWINGDFSTIIDGLEEGIIDAKIETWYQSTDPENNWSSTDKPKHEGDLWYNTTNGTTWYYEKKTTDPDTYGWSQQNVPDAVFDKIDSKKKVFYGTTVPDAPYDLNDIWVQGANGDIKICRTAKSSGSGDNSDWVKASKYTNDAAFIAFRDGAYASFVTSTNNTLGQKITTFYDSDTPTATAEGDLWIDTGNDNTLKRWDGTSWEPVRDAGIQSALTAASNAQSTADSKIMTYVNTWANRPSTDLDTGDLFIATDQNNKMYRWNGSSWVSIADTSLDSWIRSNYNADISNLQSQLDNKAETWYQSSDPSGTNYSIWDTDEKRRIHHGDLWYNTTNNTTWYFQYTNSSTYGWIQQNVPDAVFDSIDGKKDIYYTTGSTTPTPPYKEGDLWSNGVDIKICTTTKSSGNYSDTDWTLASNYIDLNEATSASQGVLNTWINSDFQTILDGIEDGIIDAKIETWYQSADPSNSWNTTEVKSEHVGDLWYYTGTTTASFKQNATYRWGSNYTWQQQNVPKEVFDQIDNKSDIYVSQPSSYKVGDLWVNATYPSSSPYTYHNDILRCITTSNSFDIDHWALASKYTDDSTVTNFINNTFTPTVANLTTGIQDAKVQVFNQNENPANSWTSEDKPKHEGDMWYCTDSTNSTYYNRFWVFTGSSWAEAISSPPQSVINTIASKGTGTIFTNDPNVSTPSNPREGDLWFRGISYPILTYVNNSWTRYDEYINSSAATDIATSATAKVKTKTQYALSTDNSSAPSADSSAWSDVMPNVNEMFVGNTRKYLWVRECVSNNNGTTYIPTNTYLSNTFNGLSLFTNTVANKDSNNNYTSINGSTITTGKIQSQDQDHKNFIQLSDGHLEFKDQSTWGLSNQGIQWNSSQGQLNVKGHIAAKSLTIDGTGGSYNAYDAINISGYNIEITTEPATSISSSSVYLYPHLYHNGTEVDYYVLTEDTEPDQDKTYYYYDSTEEEYIAYTTKPSNPKTSGAYESLYSKFIWFLNDDDRGTVGDEANRGRTLVTYSDSAKVTFTFNDGATDGGEASVTVNVDPSKYITRISDTGIEIAPENKTGNDKLAINGNSIDIYRNNVSMLHLEDSSGRFGDTTNYTKVSSTNGVEIYRDSIKRAQFDSDINLYSSDQSKRLNLSTNGLHLYNGNDDIATFSDSSIELKTDFGGSASLYAATDNDVDYIGFYIKGYNGRTIFSVHDSELDQDYSRNITLNSPTYLNSLVFINTSAGDWPLDMFIEGEGNGHEATSNTTTSLYYDDFNYITPYQNRCYIRTGSRATTFGKWAFIQLDITIRDTTTITANNYWTVLTGAPAPSTGYAALSAVAPARNNGALSAYVTSSGSITIVTDDADIPEDGRVAITGWYYLAQEGDPPAIIIV